MIYAFGSLAVSSIAIGDRLVGPGEPVLVIAEVGVNHNGDLELARALVERAAEAGADAVKFQTFSADRVARPDAPKSGYQLETTGGTESQLEMLRRLELGREAHSRLIARSRELDVVFLSTPFDEESVALLEELDVPAIKIASGELTNWPLLERAARTGRPLIISTGMADLDEVAAALAVVRASGTDETVLLHCVSSYPAEAAECNLRAISTMAEAFGVPVGYSDHTTGVETALAAVALGASVVEKHVTLDRGLPGPDHRASLEPDELARFIAAVRLVEASLGDGRKRPAPSELETRRLMRRSLVASSSIPAGTRLEPSLLRALRPATGISPALRDQVLGRRTSRDLAENEPIDWSDLE